MKLSLTKFYAVLVLMVLGYAAQVCAQSPDYFDASFFIDGLELPSPYFGGFDNAQFSNIDLDRDGILDIVVFDRQGEIVTPFLRKDGVWVFAPEYQHIFPEDLKHWMLLVDFDRDGVMDIFCSKYVAGSGIRVFKGYFDTEWEFRPFGFYDPEDNESREELIYRNLSGQIRNLEVPTADIPCIVDVDRDGDLDILSFQESGNNIYYYRNTSRERGFASDSLIFQLDTKCWGGVAESALDSELFLSDRPGDCGDGLIGEEDSSTAAITLHATSTLAAFDVHQDGDLDVFIGDADYDSLTLLNNQKQNGIDWFNSQTRSFPNVQDAIQMESFLVPFFVDVNEDNRRDMIIGSNQFLNARNINPILTYIQDESGNFSSTEDRWITEIMMDCGSNSVPVFFDVDQDGLKDLIIGNYTKYEPGNSRSSLWYFRNIGSTTQPEFSLQDDDWLNLTDFERSYFNLKPAFGDMDADGDEDLIIGTNEGRLIYVENTAGANQAFTGEEKVDNYMNIQVTLNSAPQIIDLNGDELPDLVVGNDLGYLNYFQNIGTSDEAFFDADLNAGSNQDKLGNVRVTDASNQFTARAIPYFVNTKDGLMCYIGNINGKIRVFKDIDLNNENWSEIPSPVNEIYVGKNVAPSLADINADGEYELIVGNQRGGIAIYQSNIISSVENYSSLEENEIIHIYPNPAQEYLLVNRDNYQGGEVEVELWNMLGKRVDQLTLEQNAIPHRINISSLIPGVYWCKFLEDNRLIGVQKFLKQ